MMPWILHFPQMTIRQRFCLNRWSPYAISCIRRSASHSTPGREKISFFVRVSFQTCNDLVIGGISLEDSGLLQVWHRQDPAGFEYVYSLDFGRSWNMLLAPGLTFIISFLVPPQVIRGITTLPSLIPSILTIKSIFAGIPHPSTQPTVNSSHVGLQMTPTSEFGDTRTGRIVSKFLTAWTYDIAFSPAQIDHSLGDRLIAPRFRPWE